MSADNYHLLDKRSDGSYVVLRNLSASGDYTLRDLNRMDPAFRSFDFGEALRAAHRLDRDEWTEYGLSVSPRASEEL